MVTNRKPTATSSSADTSTWLTRNEASDLCAVSVQTLQNYERRGLLHPERVQRYDGTGIQRSVVGYNPKELAKLPRVGFGSRLLAQEPGEIAARCFELLDEGKTVRDIVLALRQSPEKINQLREQWLDGGGADFVISPEAKDELEKCLGTTFSSVAGLIELVTAKLKIAA